MKDQPPLLNYPTRWSVYRGPRAHERARRSFYKWVCKEELHGPLHWELNRWGEVEHYRKEGPNYGTPYKYGYPTFKAGRSIPMEQWERVHSRHYEKALLAFQDQMRQESEARLRRHNFRHGMKAPLLTMLRTNNLINELAGQLARKNS